ncbi:MAG: DNA polymerase III subunit [Clostridiales bacterium]|jgi:DNA polymerase-3 subunit delta'|nr:DNA polymerase III subunit [Clostridiales bacterium]
MLGFNKIYGHEAIKNLFIKSIELERLAQAYLLTGGAGCGKSLLAEVFAAAALCEGRGGGVKPCGSCAACRAMESGSCADLFFVTPADGRKTIGVGDIREQVGDRLYEPPYRFARKIFIFPDGDALTPQAQNALLKMLEEPPDYAVFIITARSAERFLPTVRSRAALCRLLPLHEDLVREYLKKAGLSPDLAAFAGGSIGAALSLRDNPEFEKTLEFCRKIKASQNSASALDALSLAKEAENFKAAPSELLDALYNMYGADLRAFAAKNEKRPAREAGRRLEEILRAKAALSRNAGFAMTMDALMLGLAGL